MHRHEHGCEIEKPSNNLPNAEQSPRIVNGVLRWYEGDTFEIDIDLDLKDQDGEPIVIAPGDEVQITFADKSLQEVKTFYFTGIENNNVKLVFDADVTALFHKGIFTYDIIYKGVERTTLANDNKVVVE